MKALRFLAIALAVLMLLPAIFVSATAQTEATQLNKFIEEEIAPIDPNITEESFVVGETIYQPTLTGTGTGAPDGWMAVPEKLVPWLYEGSGGAWANFDANNNTTNKALNPAKFTRSSNGLTITIGSTDFALLMPTLKNGNNEEVDNYVYTVKAAFTSAAVKGSFGLMTGTRGSETNFQGSSNHTFYGPGHGDSWRYYHFGTSGRIDDTCISDSAANALPSPGANEFEMKVYHCDGMSHLFINGDYVNSFADKDYYNGAKLSGVGLYFCGTSVLFKEIKVQTASNKTQISDAIKLTDATVRYCDANGNTTGAAADGLRFTATVDKTSEMYTSLVNGNYAATNENVKFGMLLIPEDKIPANGVITADTEGVIEADVTKIDTQDANTLTYNVSLLGIPADQQDRVYVARAYAKVREGNAYKYIYSKTKMSRSYASVANALYTETANEAVKARLDSLFANSSNFEGANVKTLTFSIFADLHYYKGSYIASVADLNSIMAKANAAGSKFVLNAGDFSNNYPKSPEIINAYLNNEYNLPVYGVMGNHDLENGGEMVNVTPALVNRDVVWGTKNGKVGDGSIAYYYYEVDGFRVIALDTNHYYSLDDNEWKHYPSWTPGPVGNYRSTNALGPVQLEWLETVVMDAAEKDIPCIVLSHASLAGNRGSSQCSDYAAVQEIFKKANTKNAGTVLMALNGHHHSNHTDYVDGVLYFDVNTVRNGAWYNDGTRHYTNQTFEYVTYNSDGSVKSTETKKVSDLSSANKTWFFTDPLSATVTISSNGKIVIQGQATTWLDGIAPNRGADGEEPLINSGIFNTAQH